MANIDNQQWYTRSVFFVTEIEKSLYHYKCLLGFSQVWNYIEGERTIVTQVNRGSGCELILAENPARAGKSRVFVSLDSDALIAFQAELMAKGIAV